MNKLFFVTFFGLMLSIAEAQGTSQSEQTKQTFTDAEKAEVKKKVKDLSQLLDVEKTNPQTTSQTTGTNKSIGDVADRALGMVENAVGAISKSVEKVAPEVWEIMIRQQYAKAFSHIVGPLILMIISLFYTVIVKRYWPKWENYEKEEYWDSIDGPTNKGLRAVLTTIIPGVIASACSINIANRIGDVVAMLINPKYYAIQDLVRMLLK